MNHKYVKIEDIHCNHCIEVITNELLKNKKIEDVKIKKNIASITYHGNLNNSEIIEAIQKIDYYTKEEYIHDQLKDFEDYFSIKEFLIILFLFLFLWFMVYHFLGFNIFSIIPNIDSKITYGMLFVTGLLTSVHCLSMCGAIHLIAIMDLKQKNYKRTILYNLGRVISYTIIGGIVGGIGGIISFHPIVRGIIILLAAIVMLFMSLQMIGIIDFKIPILLKISYSSHNKHAFIIGLLNGLMPCGPLHAMQVYALSTGSVWLGALSMFLFSLGTVPLMLFIGFFYQYLRGRGKFILQKIASVLLLILSLVMLHRGLLSFGVDISKSFKNYGDYTPSVIEKDYQVVEFNLGYSQYEDILVQKDIPVRMIIHVEEEYLTGCNNEIILHDFEIQQKLEVGDNVIEFYPSKEGVYTYTCWMNMIKNNIKVIDDKDYFEVMS